MTTTVQPVVSGRVNSASILTTVIDNVEYYLTSDINSVPYFMQFRKGATNGLDTFTTYALRVFVTLGVGTNGPMITLRNASNNAFYTVQPEFKYISAPDPQAGQMSIAIDNKTGSDNNLLAGGISYKLKTPVFFNVLKDNIPNPNTINILTSGPSEVSNFFVIQVDNLVDSNGKSVTNGVLSSVYSYMVDDGGTVSYYFTSVQDGLNGNYIPYNFCPTLTCGPNCLGPCNGNDYTLCKREADNNQFSCVSENTATCTFTYLSIALVIDIAIVILLAYLMFSHHVNFRNNPEKIFDPKHESSTGIKITVSVLFILFAFSPVFLLMLIHFIPSVTREILGQTCNLT